MQDAGRVLGETKSLCPECLERVPGAYVTDGEAVYLERVCPDHGTTAPKVWGSVEHWEWARQFQPAAAYDQDSDLTVANDHACVVVLEVTSDCNLACPYCFASSGPGGQHRSYDEVIDLLEVILESGGPRPLQFSGGEPTVRDDLPEIIERAGELGFGHIQVNTNGIHLADRAGYAERLAGAGVTAVYLQFDGLDAETYERIRGVDLVATKHRAIDRCREAGLPVVLVPTIVPGVNEHEMSRIVRFALEHQDIVRSVNFQPVAHFGRHAEKQERFSLEQAAESLAAGFDGLDARDFKPVPCCSAYCQSATALLPGPDGPVPLTRYVDDAVITNLTGLVGEDDWMEFLAGTEAGRETACCSGGCCGVSLPDAAGALFDQALPVSFTGFMDADAADVGRLDNCCIAVPTTDGALVPFCAYNMTTTDGQYALRNRHGWGGRPRVGEPLPADD